MKHMTFPDHPCQIANFAATFNGESGLIASIIQNLRNCEPDMVSPEFDSSRLIGLAYECLAREFQLTLITEQEGTSLSLRVPHGDHNSQNVILRRQDPGKSVMSVAFNNPECPQRRKLETLMFNTQQRLSAITRDI